MLWQRFYDTQFYSQTAVDGKNPPLVALLAALLSGLEAGPPLIIGRGPGPGLLGGGRLLLSEDCDILPGTSLAWALGCDIGGGGPNGNLAPDSRLESIV